MSLYRQILQPHWSVARFLRTHRRSALIICVVASSATTNLASANPLAGQANQRQILPGGRASAMGGAYTAVADDATASYYNPAGLSYAPQQRVEVSATAYKNSDLIYKNAIDDKPFTERSESIFPNFFGGASRYGWLTIGYSFMTLDASSVYQQDSFEDISTVNGEIKNYSRTNQEASTYIWAGGSFAAKFSTHLSLGVSTFYYQRNIESTTHQLAEISGGGAYSINETLKTLNTGMATAVGLMLKGDSASIGATARFARAISDITKVSGDQVLDTGGDSSSSDPNITHWTYDYEPMNELNPPTYVLGAAWYPGKYFLLSADILMHEGVKSPYEDGHDLHTTLNYSLGLELNISAVSLRGGYFTNNSMYREPAEGAVNQPLYVNYTGVSGGLGWTVSGIQGMLSAVSQTGKGFAQIAADSPETQVVVAKTTTYIFSGNIPLH